MHYSILEPFRKGKEGMGVDRLPSGKIRLRGTYQGVSYSITGKTLKEVRAKELDKLQEIEDGLNVRGAEMQLDKFFDIWMKDRAGTVSEETVRCNELMYKPISRVVIDGQGNTFGGMKLKDIETKDVLTVRNALKESGRTTRGINDTISMLSGILQSAVNQRILTWNPCKPIKALKRTEPKATDGIHRALSRDETAAFMEAAKDSWYLNLYTVLLHSGMRIGEAGSISIGDVTETGINVHRTITRTKEGSYTIGDNPKTAAGNRFIPLDNEAAEAIRKQKKVNALLNPGKVVGIADPIFTSPRGTLLKSASVNADIERICKKAGIEYFTCHCFRDTFATRCVESRMEVKQLQSIMGHTDIGVTMGLYAHSSDERKAEQLKAVNFM